MNVKCLVSQIYYKRVFNTRNTTTKNKEHSSGWQQSDRPGVHPYSKHK